MIFPPLFVQASQGLGTMKNAICVWEQVWLLACTFCFLNHCRVRVELGTLICIFQHILWSADCLCTLSDFRCTLLIFRLKKSSCLFFQFKVKTWCVLRFSTPNLKLRTFTIFFCISAWGRRSNASLWPLRCLHICEVRPQGWSLTDKHKYAKCARIFADFLLCLLVPMNWWTDGTRCYTD